MLECLLREVRKDWNIISREVHTFDVDCRESFSSYSSEVNRADVIIVQPISESYRGVDYFSNKWISLNKKTDAKLIVFPSIYFRGYTPQSHDITQEKHITDYHDVHIADMFANGHSKDQCVDQLYSSTFFAKEFALREITRCFNQLADRETETSVDVHATPVIAASLNNSILFHTFNHPARVVMVDVANKILGLVDAKEEISVSGVDHLNLTRIMPYFSTALRLGLPASVLGEINKVTLIHSTTTLEQFVDMTYDSYNRYGAELIRGFIEGNAEAKSYLDRFNSQMKLKTDRLEYVPLVNNLYRTLLQRNASPTETYYWVKVFLEAGAGAALKEFTQTNEFQDVHSRQ